MEWLEKIKTDTKIKLEEYKKILLTNFEQYKLFFDKKLNTTITIWIIWMILLSTWAVFYSGKINLKTNVLEWWSKTEKINLLPEDLLVTKQAVITIGWEKYLLKLEKLDNLQDLRY